MSAIFRAFRKWLPPPKPPSPCRYSCEQRWLQCPESPPGSHWEDWNLVLDTNLRGSFFVAQAVARFMIPRHYGRIVNIGSITSVAVMPPRSLRRQPGAFGN